MIGWSRKFLVIKLITFSYNSNDGIELRSPTAADSIFIYLYIFYFVEMYVAMVAIYSGV